MQTQVLYAYFTLLELWWHGGIIIQVNIAYWKSINIKLIICNLIYTVIFGPLAFEAKNCKLLTEKHCLGNYVSCASAPLKCQWKVAALAHTAVFMIHGSVRMSRKTEKKKISEKCLISW